ncbi:hypothetical protein N1028_08785 [Herbiconiux sp. CPCC 203407]|uniref:PH domain-containing protein n=1 Tax=Herbiconiux oxytropis TaxID=2970915 RepID=A0AA42BTM0_9MICO|nr:hypothetical protein [Herbiconiux oxytropis]MCS5720419.1 hypothetical protein [Herbiconiux oxytropis]MCS5725992.1 hypothetical protein [Herbiconiux oxytropis]
MERLLWGAIVTALGLAILLTMVLAWRARKRRQAAFGAPATDDTGAAGRGTALAQSAVLYVATTLAGQPLERLTIPGLAFRGRGIASVFGGGVAIAIPGEPETFIPAARIRSIGTSTWAIDRVVESGGLVRLDWTYDSATGPVDVESYLRPTQLGDSTTLIDSTNSIIPQQEGPSS